MSGQQIGSGKLLMTVSSEIVKYFSIGLYQNFARAVKELISNSYDAKATEVRIRLDLLSGRIIVRDNGIGMDLKDLGERFLAIGAPTSLTEDVDELGRKRIGTFGIGSVAVFPYCEKVIVLTKKRYSNQNIQLDIDSSRFFKGGTFQLGVVEKAEFPYTITKSDLPDEQGETIIILEEIKPHILNELRETKKPIAASINELSGYEKFKWTLCQYCPLQYPSEYIELAKYLEYKNRVPLRVWLDGIELFRNVPDNSRILDKGEKQFGSIKIKYVIMSPYGVVRPEEAKGLQIRLRDVAIGLPSDFEITKLTGKVPGKLNYLCGEIHILEGLSNALMIDRDSFSFTQEVAELQGFFRKKLNEWNTILENQSKHDKDLYEGFQFTENGDKILTELMNADIIKLPRGRLRISKRRISRSKRRIGESPSPISRITDVLSKEKGISVKTSKIGNVDLKSPIEISEDKKNITIYENHPAFIEKVAVLGKEFPVDYSRWSIRTTPSICKLVDGKAIFNLSHPLFHSELSERVVKELSLGLLLILEDEQNSIKLLERIEKILVDIFIDRDGS